MEKIRDKRVLIVGASGSIGRYTAQMLAGAGAHVFLTGRNKERLMHTANALHIPEEQCFVLDLDDTVGIGKMGQTIHETGPLDILINAAGIGIIKPLEQLSLDEFSKTLQTNLVAPFLLMKTFLPPMKEAKKGLIINIPGVLGKTPMAGAAAYAASKYGLNGMMKSIREELKRTDIRITQLFLGGVDSSFWDTIDLRVQRDKMIMAEEVGKTIWFLCQQPSSAVVSEMVVQPFNHQAI